LALSRSETSPDSQLPRQTLLVTRGSLLISFSSSLPMFSYKACAPLPTVTAMLVSVPTGITAAAKPELIPKMLDFVARAAENRVSSLLNGRFFAVRSPHSLAQYSSFSFRISSDIAIWTSMGKPSNCDRKEMCSKGS